jgi:hypothetical protein
VFEFFLSQKDKHTDRIWIFGTTDRNESIALSVENYFPQLLIRLPYEWLDKNSLRTKEYEGHVNSLLEFLREEPRNFQIVHHEIIDRIDVVGFTNMKKKPYLLLRMVGKVNCYFERSEKYSAESRLRP